MEINTVTLLADLTCSVPPELLTLPPSATARASARNLTLPARPLWSPEMPSSAAVVPSGLERVVRCGLPTRRISIADR